MNGAFTAYINTNGAVVYKPTWVVGEQVAQLVHGHEVGPRWLAPRLGVHHLVGCMGGAAVGRMLDSDAGGAGGHVQ